MSGPNALDVLRAHRPRLVAAGADEVHGDVDRQLLAVVDALLEAHDVTVRRADIMERIDALNTMRTLERVAEGLARAAEDVADACRARDWRASPPRGST